MHFYQGVLDFDLVREEEFEKFKNKEKGARPGGAFAHYIYLT